MLDLATPENDGLIIPEVGEWSHHKHYFLLRYIDAFTIAMRDNRRWSGLHYIDLFAGAGIDRLESSGKLVWGSPLIAAQATKPFARIHLCEKDKNKHLALDDRLRRFRPQCNDQVLHGDANERVSEIVAEIPSKALCLAFLDPYGLHVDYETLRSLSNRRADLVIFFPDRMDALRNLEAYYWDNPESNLDSVLGPGSDWRNKIKDIPVRNRAGVLRKTYEDQIKKLGYTHFDAEPVPSTGARLYWLLFCARSHVATDIWRGTASKKPNEQRTFDFGANT